MCINPNIDLVKINAHAKFNPIPSIYAKHIEWKQNSDNNQGPKLCLKFAKIDV